MALSTPKKQSTGEFIALMALLMSMVAMTIDMILPGFHAIGTAFQVTDQNQLQLLISSVFLGMAVGQLFYGPLSDSIGRKTATNIGLAIFIVGSLISIYAQSFEVMLIGRVLQGFGTAGPRTITVAFVRDQYAGREMARIMSFVMSIFVLMPALAPAVGAGVIMISGWEGMFYTFILMALIAAVWMTLRQPETLHPEYRIKFEAKPVLSAAKEVLTNRRSVGYMVVAGMCFAILVIYLNTSKLLYLDIYGVDELFPLYFSFLAIAVGAASIVNGKIVVKYGMRALMSLALKCLIVVSGLFLIYVLAIDGPPPFVVFLVVMSIAFFFMGIMFGNANALAMEPMGHIAGVASSVIGSGTTFVSMILGTLIGMQYDQTLVPMLAGFTGLAILSLALMGWIEKGSNEKAS